mgnify:CR=1 FL=1
MFNLYFRCKQRFVYPKWDSVSQEPIKIESTQHGLERYFLNGSVTFNSLKLRWSRDKSVSNPEISKPADSLRKETPERRRKRERKREDVDEEKVGPGFRVISRLKPPSRHFSLFSLAGVAALINFPSYFFSNVWFSMKIRAVCMYLPNAAFSNYAASLMPPRFNRREY